MSGQHVYIIMLGDGTRVWLDDRMEPHREEGPAVECSSGDKGWYVHGYLKRRPGKTSAVELSNRWNDSDFLFGRLAVDFCAQSASRKAEKSRFGKLVSS